jgi:dUTP pyrophosphatase
VGNRSLSIRLKTWAHFRGELPVYQTSGSSGFDVRAQLTGPLELAPGARALIPTGLSFELPEGFELQVRPRSGWAINKGVTVTNTPGTIDSDYRGEVKVGLINLGGEMVVIQDQDRIAQMVLAPVYRAEFQLASDLMDTARRDGGFGSTGYSK